LNAQPEADLKYWSEASVNTLKAAYDAIKADDITTLTGLLNNEPQLSQARLKFTWAALICAVAFPVLAAMLANISFHGTACGSP
jgi:hypothetical protein